MRKILAKELQVNDIIYWDPMIQTQKRGITQSAIKWPREKILCLVIRTGDFIKMKELRSQDDFAMDWGLDDTEEVELLDKDDIALLELSQ